MWILIMLVCPLKKSYEELKKKHNNICLPTTQVKK